MERKWGPWLDWLGEDGGACSTAIKEAIERELLVEVERRGPDAENWRIAEAHQIDWTLTGGKEDVVRFRVQSPNPTTTGE